MQGDPALRRVIAQVGGKRALARELAISPQTVSQWERVPIRHALTIERLTGIPREELRPDIYPADRRSITAAPAVTRR